MGPAGCGPGQIALHGLRFGARGERVTWGGHLLQPVGRPRRLGQFARRHYWRVPRSDDAVGAGSGLLQCAGEVDCSIALSAFASSVMVTVVEGMAPKALALRTGRVMDWSAIGCASPSLSAAGFKEMWPARAMRSRASTGLTQPVVEKKQNACCANCPWIATALAATPTFLRLSAVLTKCDLLFEAMGLSAGACHVLVLPRLNAPVAKASWTRWPRWPRRCASAAAPHGHEASFPAAGPRVRHTTGSIDGPGAADGPSC